jgi:hypothetical protein
VFFSSPISGLIPKLDCVGFVVDKVTLRNVFMSVLRSSAVSIIPLVLPEHSCICYSQQLTAPLINVLKNRSAGVIIRFMHGSD